MSLELSELDKRRMAFQRRHIGVHIEAPPLRTPASFEALMDKLEEMEAKGFTFGMLDYGDVQ